MPKFEVNLSDALYARMTHGARRDHVYRTVWAREALAAYAAFGEAIELLGDPESVQRLLALLTDPELPRLLAEHETRITALEQQRDADAT